LVSIDKFTALAATSNGVAQSLPTDTYRRTCYNNAIFRFNENIINRFLYFHFDGNNIPFPSELKTKIANNPKKKDN